MYSSTLRWCDEEACVSIETLLWVGQKLIINIVRTESLLVQFSNIFPVCFISFMLKEEVDEDMEGR